MRIYIKDETNPKAVKVAVVPLSKLTDCWSALRFTGRCSECERVARCKLPEAKSVLARKCRLKQVAREAAQRAVDQQREIDNL